MLNLYRFIFYYIFLLDIFGIMVCHGQTSVKPLNSHCKDFTYTLGNRRLDKIILLGFISIVCIARTSGKTDYWTANQDDETKRFFLSVRTTLPWIVFGPQGRAQR